MTTQQQVQHQQFDEIAQNTLARFERRTRNAAAVNLKSLRDTLALNHDTEFGKQHGFDQVLAATDPCKAFHAAVPLSEFKDYEQAVDRIAAGEENILTADPVHMFAGSAGTTGRSKRIPRTRRVQQHHLTLVVLVAKAVLHRGIPGANAPRRGVNLMSLYSPPAENPGSVPVISGPNAGLQQIRHQIPLRWTSPVPAYSLTHQPTMQYLHALFALRERDALYVETPFSPQLVSWFTQMEKYQSSLVADLTTGKLADHLALSPQERVAIEAYLEPAPERAVEVQAIFAKGFAGVVLRLWPKMCYLRAVTSGSFALSMPRLKWLTDGQIPIYSGSYSSSEGIIGINLTTDGPPRYTLACGTAYFEFIAEADLDEAQPQTVDISELIIGDSYEIVLTSCAGLYRYRLGDIVRIDSFHNTAPTIEFLYRRGTILNLVGEKTTEHHTAYAITTALKAATGSADCLTAYCVAGERYDGTGYYTFYAELNVPSNALNHQLLTTESHLDTALCEINDYYRSNARESEQLQPARLKFVREGTFSSLIKMRASLSGANSTAQFKPPRVVWEREQIEFLESRCINSRTCPS